MREVFVCEALRTPIGRYGGALSRVRTDDAIALGHPLGMSGARLIMTAVHQLQRSRGRRALATMCVGVDQGVALAHERL